MSTMMMTPNAQASDKPGEGATDANGLELSEFTQWMNELQEQPAWRAKADREMDYCDGNQLDSQILQKMREIGMPPAIEPLMGPTLDAVLGMEVKNRTDCRVIPDSDTADDDVATALNAKLNQAERRSYADTACSEAYNPQVKVGLGWVEVSRDEDPFNYPYRCCAIHRNEIWWDWLAKPDLSNARYLVRRKWTDRKLAALMFPDKKEVIEHSGAGWMGIDPGTLSLDGGTSTDLAMSYSHERGWSIEEMEWRDTANKRVCLFEVWYRRWVSVLILKSPDGRIVEYDPKNEMHVQAVASGVLIPERAIVGKVFQSWWMGPHKLSDRPSPFKHNKFPYVPFWGKREDRTNVPFALARGMMFLQDEVNARISKMQWGLAATRTTRTKGAVLDTDENFRQNVARPDADIVLDPKEMAKPGAVFKVERDFNLNQAQAERLRDAREGIRRVGGIYSEFQGQNNNTTSGVQFDSQVEQSNQSLADINDNFKTARAAVMDLLLSLIIEDTIGKEEDVFIDGKGIDDDRTIRLNVPTTDPDTGIQYLTNDVQRTKLKVTLEEVPSTPSYRSQQRGVMGEVMKSLPPEYQRVLMPFMVALMDMPNRVEIIRAIKEVGKSASPEQIQQQIDEAVKKALTEARIEIEHLKLTQNQALVDAQVKKIVAEAVSKSVEGMFSATQAANLITANPSVAQPADQMLASAGFIDADAAPGIPNAPPGSQAIQLPKNTNPLTPTNPAVGMNSGIEGGGINQGVSP